MVTLPGAVALKRKSRNHSQYGGRGRLEHALLYRLKAGILDERRAAAPSVKIGWLSDTLALEVAPRSARIALA